MRFTEVRLYLKIIIMGIEKIDEALSLRKKKLTNFDLLRIHVIFKLNILLPAS
jgi:hypothetical protein